MHAAVVELDALADAVGTAAQHHDLLFVRGLRLVFVLIGRIEVGGLRLEFRGAGVNALVDGTDVELVALRANVAFLGARQLCDALVGETLLLQVKEIVMVEVRELRLRHAPFDVNELLHLREEPGIDRRHLVDLLHGHAEAHGVRHVEDALGAGFADLVHDLFAIVGQGRQAVLAGLKPSQRLLQGFLEGRADRHHFAHGLHLGGEAVVGLRELLKRKARHLGDDVVDRRFERSRRRAARDVVLQFVKRVAHRELRGDLRDREACRLRREGRGAGHARVHFDHDQTAVLRIHRKLHVGAARIDADFAQHGDRRVAHDLVLAVRQGLRRRHRDGVARVDAHRVEVFDGADDDAVVRLVADHFHLVLLPAEKRFFNEELVRGRQRQAALADFHEFLHVVGDAAAGAPEREGRTNHGGEAHLRLHGHGFGHVVGDAGAGALKADAVHRLLEALAVLGLVDRFRRSADQLHVVLLEDAFLVQGHREVQGRLAAHRGQNGVGLFTGDDAFQNTRVERFNVGGVRGVRVGHDRGRIGIHQNDAVPLFAQRLAGLSAGVVKFAGLADNDRAGAENHDGFDVCTFGHGIQSFK